jgi:hypothetical protein
MHCEYLQVECTGIVDRHDLRACYYSISQNTHHRLVERRLDSLAVVNRSIGVLRADLIKICLIRLPWRFLAILPSNYRRCIPVLDLVRKTQANYGTSGCPYNHIKGVAYFDITERIHDAAH